MDKDSTPRSEGADIPSTLVSGNPTTAKAVFERNPESTADTDPVPKAVPLSKRSYLLDSDVRRDSGLAASTTNAGKDSLAQRKDDTKASPGELGLPEILVHDENGTSAAVQSHQDGSNARQQQLLGESSTSQADQPSFQGITTAIPSGNFEDLNVEFSKRGSVLLSGKRLNTILDKLENPGSVRQGGQTSLAPSSSVTGARVLSMDEMIMSKKVRSMYEHGNELGADWEMVAQEPAVEDDGNQGSSAHGLVVQKTRKPRESGNMTGSSSPNDKSNRRISMIKRDPYETAGGVEDWQEVQGADVDRYGFIVPKRIQSRASSSTSTAMSEPPGLQRMSTALRMISESPRRKRSLRRTPSGTRSARSAVTNKSSSRQVSPQLAGPSASIYSNSTTQSARMTRNPLRFATNRFPHNRERRWMDEAGDMLTLPPGLADIREQEDAGRAELEMKRKEWSREEKWRRMGTPLSGNAKGGGMAFKFDTKDPKLINRTWKGIPDSWRATAWHAFLSASAKQTSNASDEELVDAFYDLQEQPSADDMQIDVDVPRTISSHVMFRRRYRGGQRLLFRVLHAMSIYFPEIGYVQGMASLAATLLCYYDEEKAFIMMVRLWQHRGLEHLYRAGFGGLMEALGDFEKDWLADGDVAKQLHKLGITPTAYGTRWYLTLFNYSIPFQAQLRVWDVFMLLGDASHSCNPASAFGCDLDVLHATSAALIDATREIILDSDFENAMKVLTSWIPIRDEDFLMRVAKAEWRQRKKRARS